MKIGIFTNNYLPNPYGVTRSIETFRREFEKQGHEVFVFAPRWKGYEDNNINVIISSHSLPSSLLLCSHDTILISQQTFFKQERYF